MSNAGDRESGRYAYVTAHAIAHASAQASAQAEARAKASAYRVSQLRPRRTLRDGFSVGISVILHVMAIVLAIGLTRAPKDPEKKASGVTPVTPPPMRFISLPPLPAPTPKQQQAPRPQPPRILVPGERGPAPTPTPPARQSDTPEQHPNATPDQTPKVAARDVPHPADKAQPSETDRPHPSVPDPIESPATPQLRASMPTEMETEAERLFGHKATPLDPSSAVGNIRPFESRERSRQGTCNAPPPKADSSGQIPKGTVVGRIVSEDTHRPLRGALLEFVGTAYTAITDDRGEFLLLFDRSLVDLCRPQWVRVHASGYESMLLPLTIGDEVESVPLRRQ
ncbi:MAG: hypothetical protein ABJD11_16155 [Gemmatimonadota bacterium]